MEHDNNILNMFRKIICSLLCINKNTKNVNIKMKSSEYLEKYLKEYELCLNKKKYSLVNYEEIINFCNECYEDIDVFDYAEDVEYGLKELMEITISKGGK